ncbi:MAG: ATP-grasp domain-containing protein [Candidatus Gracilibacteria bacterium]|jgi:hypothetical protein|nr:ATP-grasp domain-containing protein [Candidatus Gracilibacteria bacterium]
MIKIFPLCPESIEELSQEKALYISDFRALGESFEYEIDSMWKYENLMPWIVKKGFCTVNENSHNLSYPSANLSVIICEQGDRPSIPIIKRIKNTDSLFSKLDQIWTAVPHPEIDKISSQLSLPLNYKYSEFLNFNNKLSVKKLLGDLTPDWHTISDLNMLKGDYKSGKYIIKRSIGAGGFTTFFPNSIELPEKLLSLFSSNDCDWYSEELIDSIPMSIQCYKNDDDITIFGYSKQIMGNNVEFIGAEFLDLESLKKDTVLQNFILRTLSNLNSFLSNFRGFFGIDFFYDSNKNYYFLEINARVTALTIPVLLHNQKLLDTSKYFEDYDGNISKVKYLLTVESKLKTYDVII